MAVEIEPFGIEELQKAFEKAAGKYDDKADALLMAQGKLAQKRVKSRTPVGSTRKLKGSWRLKKVRKVGDTRVVRVQSTLRYAHLVEQGHDLARRDGKRRSRIGRALRGANTVGRVEGRRMLEETMRELESRYTNGVQKLLDELTKEFEV